MSCKSDARSCRPGWPATTRSSTRAAARSATRPRLADLARARALIRAAGAEGAKVTVWGYRPATGKSDVVQSYTEMLNQIGLDAEVKMVDFKHLASDDRQCGDRRRRPGIEGLDAGVFSSAGLFHTRPRGRDSRPTNNRNTSNIDDPRINGSGRPPGARAGHRCSRRRLGGAQPLPGETRLPGPLRPSDPRDLRLGPDRLRELHGVSQHLPRGLLSASASRRVRGSGL